MTNVGEPRCRKYEIGFEAFGVRICVASNDPGDVREFLKAYAANFPDPAIEIEPATASHRFFLFRDGDRADTLLRDGSVVGNGINGIDLFPSLVSLVRLTVAEFAVDRVFVHAGVVAVDGRVIVLPGKSKTGKSTLVTELVRFGAEYFSDEYAVFDRQGLVHPFPKPLSLRLNDGDPTQTDIAVETIGGTVGKNPGSAVLIATIQYEKDADLSIPLITPGEGTMDLIANAISIRRDPSAVLSAFAKVSETAVFLRGVRGEARIAAESILNIAAGSDP